MTGLRVGRKIRRVRIVQNKDTNALEKRVRKGTVTGVWTHIFRVQWDGVRYHECFQKTALEGIGGEKFELI
jgi:hypothetical protein